MAFKKPKKQPEFADLIGILAQTKKADNSLYQTVQEIINRLVQLQDLINEDIAKKLSEQDAAKRFATKFATFLTLNDETAALPNSLQLLAGSGIVLDSSVPNHLTISSSGGSGLGNHYDCPLSDGDTAAADLIFADGECIIVQVPV